MTILSVISKNGNTIKVEVLDVYNIAGVKYDTVKALEGKPFASGDKWPRFTEYAVVPAADMVKPNGSRCSSATEPTLLDLALSKARDQWFETQTVWLWGGPRKGAFLKASEGVVTLNITRYTPSLKVWWLDLMTGQWKQARNLESKYQSWAAKAQQEVVR